MIDVVKRCRITLKKCRPFSETYNDRHLKKRTDTVGISTLYQNILKYKNKSKTGTCFLAQYTCLNTKKNYITLHKFYFNKLKFLLILN